MEKEKNSRITESEWQIMEQIWAHNEAVMEQGKDRQCGEADASADTSLPGITQSRLMELLENKWNKNTVHTFLKRLCDKGFLEVVKEASPHRYVALVSRADCEKEERQNFLERIYQGSVSRMVASFVREGGLSKQEAAELRRLLEETLEEKE